MFKSFKRFGVILALVAGAVFSTGCTRITTGEVGVRVDASRQIQGTELMPGSWNQTIIGDVLTFPVKDVAIEINDKRHTTVDNSPLGDFDMTVVYNINPTSVADLWSTKSKSFHFYAEKEDDTYLMFNYMVTLSNNAAYKVVRKYNNLEVADKRSQMEQQIRDELQESLKAEKLDSAISISAVQIRNVMPNQQILEAATALVKSQNELKIKDNEVQIAKKESERMAALANNSTQSIAFMNAQAQMMIAEGIKNGKVQTIVVPMDFKGIVSVGK